MPAFSIFKLFSNNTKKVKSPLVAEEELIVYLLSLINKPDEKSRGEVRLKGLAKLKAQDQLLQIVKLYFDLEDYIVGHSPPLTQKPFSRNSLRNEIKLRFNIYFFSPYLRAVFLTNNQQLFCLYLLGINFLANYLLSYEGEGRLKSIIAPLINNTMLKGMTMTADGKIDVQIISQELPQDQAQHINSIFNQILESFYNSMHNSLGDQVVGDIFHKLAAFMKSTYDYDLNSKFFNLLPKGILEDEKVYFASREELSQQVLQRTQLLEEEKARIAASIASLNIGFIITDHEGKILVINDTAKHTLCGTKSLHSGLFKRDEGLDTSCTIEEIESHLKESFDLRAEIMRCINESKPLEFQEVAYHDEFLHITLNPIVLLKETLNVIGSVIVVQDVTKEKSLERTRDEFFSIASHELRTPLTAIRGNTSMIQQFYQEILKDPQLKEMIQDIHESSIRLIEIVNDFLDSSRLEQGKVEFKKEAFDMPTLVHDVIKEFQASSLNPNVALSFEPPQAPLPQILADRDRAKQILINLLGNSSKFTQRGSIVVSLVGEGGFVKVMVKDTGKGISEGKQELLFRKFQQISGSNILTRDTTKGTGLGLYISRLLAQGMGGEIKLENSVEGVGSTFSFSLPMAPTVKKEMTIPPVMTLN